MNNDSKNAKISDRLSDISERAENIGETIGVDIAKGINNSKNIVEDAINSVSSCVISKTDEYLSEKERIAQKHSEQEQAQAEATYKKQLSKAKSSIDIEKIKQDRIIELEQNADNAYLKQLEQAAAQEEKIRNDAFRNLKYSLDAGYITEEQYYNSLANLRNVYFSEDSEEWQKYSLQILNYQESVLKDKKEQIIKILSQTSDEIEKIQGKVEKNLSKYGDLYSTITAKYKKAGENGQDFIITSTKLSDLSEQTNFLREYADALAAVSKRGDIPDDLFQQLRDMEVEDGLAFANALLSVSDDDFAEYIEAYKEKQEQISKITGELTKEQTDSLIEDMNSQLSQVYGEIPEDFWDCGANSATSFKSGFLSELKGIFTEIQTEISAYANQITPEISPSTLSTQTSYSASYNFYSSGQTVAQQLQAARSQATIDALRGGYA